VKRLSGPEAEARTLVRMVERGVMTTQEVLTLVAVPRSTGLKEDCTETGRAVAFRRRVAEAFHKMLNVKEASKR